MNGGSSSNANVNASKDAADTSTSAADRWNSNNNNSNLQSAFALRVAMRDENITKKEIKEINLKEQAAYPKVNFVVRVPLVNPFAYADRQGGGGLKMFVYINSKKPQEYWDAKHTHVCVDSLTS